MARRKRTEGTEPAPAAAPQAVGGTTVAAPDRDRIALRAYELYLARGAGEGAAMDDWLSAERELSSNGRNRHER
jgi:hypothetical protein